jgi:hypothetical protein
VNVDFDLAVTNDNEPIIERFMRTVEDSCRSQYNIRILCGTYAQTHEPHDNSMAARTSPSIALGPLVTNVEAIISCRYVLDEWYAALNEMSFPCRRMSSIVYPP